MDKILAKKDFPQWLKKLKSYRIYAPRKQDDIWNYEVVNESDDYHLPDVITAAPAKKIVFPQRECFFKFSETDESSFQITELLPEETPVVVFGLRPCEGKALILTDKVFGGKLEDPYYMKRRKATTFVGLACSNPPSPNCFCLSVDGSPHSKEGLDLLLTDLGEAYYVESLTDKGEQLIREGKMLFADAKPKDIKKVNEIHAEAEKKIPRQLSRIESVRLKLRDMFDSHFWDEESMSCISCGICTYLCPTCHCFDINDEVEASPPLQGKRVRTWDTCQFPDFTMHSSGHNPRPDKAARLRQRINHKFQYFVEAWQHNQCTGCGRCISLCPVGIDIIKVVEKVRDYGS